MYATWNTIEFRMRHDDGQRMKNQQLHHKKNGEGHRVGSRQPGAIDSGREPSTSAVVRMLACPSRC